MAVPNTFADQAGPIPLGELDENFDYMLDSPVFTGAPSVNVNNTTDALTLETPTNPSATWDGQPLAALHIRGPASPTTRNFLSGIWVETEGNAVDKGRGIIITNTGASDGLYVQCDGASGTGMAVLLQTGATSATGLVIGTTVAGQVGVVLRQETAITPTAAGNLLAIEAEGTGSTEMVRIGSATKNSQIGIIFRFFGSGCLPMVVADSGGNVKWRVDTFGSVEGDGNYTIYKHSGVTPGGAANVGYLMGNTGMGVFFGSGAPALSAGQGSLYLRADGTGTNDRAYINTNGSTGWTELITAT
jgi:hypothetical protein